MRARVRSDERRDASGNLNAASIDVAGLLLHLRKGHGITGASLRNSISAPNRRTSTGQRAATASVARSISDCLLAMFASSSATIFTVLLICSRVCLDVMKKRIRAAFIGTAG